MIVDTPGIGPDNDVLTQRLFDYLPSALAFIYIINPTNAGGIQIDRVCQSVQTSKKWFYFLFVWNKTFIGYDKL